FRFVPHTNIQKRQLRLPHSKMLPRSRMDSPSFWSAVAAATAFVCLLGERTYKVGAAVSPRRTTRHPLFRFVPHTNIQKRQLRLPHSKMLPRSRMDSPSFWSAVAAATA